MKNLLLQPPARVRRFLLVLCVVVHGCLVGCAPREQSVDASLDFVPRAVTVEKVAGKGRFLLNAKTVVSFLGDAEGPAKRQADKMSEAIFRAIGRQLPVLWIEEPGAEGCSGSSEIRISTLEGVAGEPDTAQGPQHPEGYRLELEGQCLRIEASTEDGLFYGTQTLLQMLPPSAAEQTAVRFPFDSLIIEDSPRFRWRGMHLDVGRHWFEVEDIKRLLDTMAFFKFNVFHWHLTEDQGWRIEIKKYPRLTEVGAFRKSTPVKGDRDKDDGIPYGGFYTQEQIRDVVAYAANLHIDVMPEIELPGHSTAAIAAYPALGNPEFVEGLEVGHRWGVHPNTLHPSPETLSFYEDVFEEVLALFPFEFVHIGGDEAPKQQWRQSPSTQARMKELGTKTEDDLQAWFVAHFQQFLSERGRRLVGWDEIQEGGLPAGATMMVWRGSSHGVEAARTGHDIIMAPRSHTYLDYYQSDAAGEPEAIGGLLTLEDVYSFDPVLEELQPHEQHHILGAQGQLWTEYIHQSAKLEYMAFPRALALAEVVWSSKRDRDWNDFERRLEWSLAHLDARGVGYRSRDAETSDAEVPDSP